MGQNNNKTIKNSVIIIIIGAAALAVALVFIFSLWNSWQVNNLAHNCVNRGRTVELNSNWGWGTVNCR